MNRQRGVALIAFMVLLLTGASFFLVRALTSRAAAAADSQQTWQTLNEAKEALIGYAVTYPDRINPQFGPGYLPCPNIDGSGTARPACALGTSTNTGKLPWRTLDMNDPRDASGSPLWYALSNNYRYNPHLEPLNSDTPGELSVDADSDIVAVIIAPGPALAGQNRNSAPNDPVQFLEGENATIADAVYTRLAGNDQVMLITRQDLMMAVEQRVLGEVTRALGRYSTSFAAYPWLSPFAQPDTASFKAVVGTTTGLLPLHFAADPAPGAGENPFATGFAASWNLANATVVTLEDGDPDNAITPACITQSNCVDPDFGSMTINATAANATFFGNSPPGCYWYDPDTANAPVATDYARCFAMRTFVFSKPYIPAGPGIPVSGRLQRTYTITATVRDTTAGGADIAAPNATTDRTRTVTSLAPADPDLVDASQSIIVTIEQLHFDIMGLYPIRRDAVQMTADPDTTGSFGFAGVAYALDADRGEVPGWLLRNDWHQLVYVDYSPAYAPGSMGSCDIAANCITLRVQRPAPAGDVDLVDQRGIVMLAGRSIAGPRPSASLADYFETENDAAATPNAIYTRAAHSALFNDQIRSSGTAP